MGPIQTDELAEYGTANKGKKPWRQEWSLYEAVSEAWQTDCIAILQFRKIDLLPQKTEKYVRRTISQCRTQRASDKIIEQLVTNIRTNFSHSLQLICETPHLKSSWSEKEFKDANSWMIDSLWQPDLTVWMKALTQKVSSLLITGSERGYRKKDLSRKVQFLSFVPQFAERILQYLNL